ncbi:MAG TPA: response regulator [Dyella sp.]|uniref:response regulator n=1 Tax=Dyella sp. TaxID=1869338 RepID=UPI002D15950B|nr:response regulator [Dyella sp.]HUB90607.1 response regulator [Dyella sp.]
MTTLTFAASPAAPEPLQAASRARVLLVDDDERNLHAITNVLEDIAEVVPADSGEEALRQLLKSEFAVILLDVYMPGMDGYETAQLIRAREQTKRIPIIFLSAVNKEMAHLLRGYAMGAVDYVFKPVEPIVLQSKVSVFVDLFMMRREVQQKALQEQELESQLLHARKMDALGQITGGIAHDFNNLLAAVLGGLEMLQLRVPMAPEHRRLFNITRRAAEQGAALVARLLAFARKQKLEPASIDVDRLSTAVTQMLEHTLGGMVTLQWHRDEDLWHPYADAAQLELALVNLVINARDAMPEGGTIRITGRNAHGGQAGLPQGDYVVLAVSDTGVGIAPHDLERVTEPFFTTKAQGKGTGLGLSMVYGFARQSGGMVRIKSRLDEGTTVEVWLPRAAGSPQTAADTPSTAKLPSTASNGSQHILLIDDHDSVRLTTMSLLEELGYRVTALPDGVQAVQLPNEELQAVDVLISDYAMPQMSGSEVIRKLRTKKQALPAIIITGYADAIANIPESVRVLNKPFTLTQLQEAIAAVETRQMA